MKYCKTSENYELIVDDSNKLMALRLSDHQPWVRTTSLGKQSMRFYPLLVSLDDKIVLTLISKIKTTGLVEESSFGEYSSAPDLSSLTLDILESREFKLKNENVKKELNGDLLLTGDIENAMRVVDKYGIQDVVDSISPGEIALLISHFKKIGREETAQEAYFHFEKFVYGSHVFTDMPREYMEDFNKLIEECKF